DTGEGERAIIKITDKDGKLLGYAFKAKGNGYQGEIKLVSGLDNTLSNLVGIEVLESQETPGLGAEISSENFRKQFVSLSVVHPIEYVKNRKPEEKYQIEAITGATISSRAVVNILNKRIKEVREILKGKQ
ncbi:MAG: FMN-binding protein, partial [Candidatus Omnitrophota bacterium]